MGGPGIPWRFAVLGGATAGVALSPAGPRRGPGPRRRRWCSGWPPDSASSSRAPATAAPRGRSGWRCLRSSPRPPAWPWAWVASTAIDRGAFRGPIGRPATARGFVTAVPRRSRGEVRVRIQTDDGRLGVEASEPVGDLPIGRQVKATGTLARARALGGRLPGALRHPPGARRRPARAHRPASRWARRGDGSHPRPRRARPGQRDPGRGGRAPAWLRAWRGRSHRRGHGRRLQALRDSPIYLPYPERT